MSARAGQFPDTMKGLKAQGEERATPERLSHDLDAMPGRFRSGLVSDLHPLLRGALWRSPAASGAGIRILRHWCRRRSPRGSTGLSVSRGVLLGRGGQSHSGPAGRKAHERHAKGQHDSGSPGSRALSRGSDPCLRLHGRAGRVLHTVAAGAGACGRNGSPQAQVRWRPGAGLRGPSHGSSLPDPCRCAALVLERCGRQRGAAPGQGTGHYGTPAWRRSRALCPGPAGSRCLPHAAGHGQAHSAAPLPCTILRACLVLRTWRCPGAPGPDLSRQPRFDLAPCADWPCAGNRAAA